MTVVLSDHKNLMYWRSPQNLNRRQARWFLILSEYNIKLEHMPRHKMIQSDALSRRPDLIPEGENEENTDITMLPETLFINLIDTELQKQITGARPLDKNAMEALETLLKNTNVTSGTSINDWSFEEGDHGKLLFYKDKVYVPNDQELRKSIVMHFHDPVTAGHPGQIETYNAVATSYWWPGMRRFISAYVKGCSTCQQFKINRNPARPTLMPIPAPESLKPFAQTSMDLITDLPPSLGYDSILSVVDHGLTKGVILIPCSKTITAEGTAKLLLDNLYKRFGLPATRR
jgi:hypothetical protein